MLTCTAVYKCTFFLKNKYNNYFSLTTQMFVSYSLLELMKVVLKNGEKLSLTRGNLSFFIKRQLNFSLKQVQSVTQPVGLRFEKGNNMCTVCWHYSLYYMYVNVNKGMLLWAKNSRF
jgi:hypothetical protein